MLKYFGQHGLCEIKRTKYMRNINNNAVQGCLSENYLTRKIIAWNILDTKYSKFTVCYCIILNALILSADIQFFNNNPLPFSQWFPSSTISIPYCFC